MAGSEYSNKLVYVCQITLTASFLTPFLLKNSTEIQSLWKIALIDLTILFSILFFQKISRLVILTPQLEEFFVFTVPFTLRRIDFFILVEYILGKIQFFALTYILQNQINGLSAFCLYYIILVFYHNGEFIFVATCQYELLSYDSFLLYHSNAYQFAHDLSIFEFWVEYTYFPDYKNQGICYMAIIFGLQMIFGMICRMSAFYYANINFTHLVATKKRPEHMLITHGIYAFSRHPSYFGYFLLAVSGQLMLKNLFCAVCYMLVLYFFFLERLELEEYALEKFFGRAYREYRSKVGSKIPFLDKILAKRLISEQKNWRTSGQHNASDEEDEN